MTLHSAVCPEIDTCPFCGEDGFDTMGAAYHIVMGLCDRANELVETQQAEMRAFHEKMVERYDRSKDEAPNTIPASTAGEGGQ